MGGEDHLERPAEEIGEALFDLGRVAVGGNAIGMKALGHLAEERGRTGLTAGAAHARLGIDDDAVGVDQGPLAQKRDQGEFGGGGVAAGIGHKPCLADGLAIVFAETVDRLALKFRRPVRPAVGGLIHRRIPQAEVGREVDDAQMPGQACHHLLGEAVGQAAEHRLHGLEVHLLQPHQRRQGEAGQVREHLAERAPGMAFGRQCHDLDEAVAGQQPHQFRAGIAARPEDGDADAITGHGCLPRGAQMSPISTSLWAIWTALRAAPLRRLSATTHSARP